MGLWADDNEPRGDFSHEQGEPVCDERLPGCTEFPTVFATDRDGAGHKWCKSCEQAVIKRRQVESFARVGRR